MEHGDFGLTHCMLTLAPFVECLVECFTMKELMMCAAANRDSNSSLTVATSGGRRMCVVSLSVDEFEQWSETILLNIHLPKLLRLTLYGCADDLRRVLLFISSLARWSCDWHVLSFKLHEEESEEAGEVLDLSSLTKTWGDAVSACLSSICKTATQHVSLCLASPLSTEAHDAIGSSLAASIHVRDVVLVLEANGRQRITEHLVRRSWEVTKSDDFEVRCHRPQINRLVHRVADPVSEPALEVEQQSRVGSAPLSLELSLPVTRIHDPYAGYPGRRRLDKVTGHAVSIPTVVVIARICSSDLRDVVRDVSSWRGVIQHLVIERSGSVLQFVDLGQRAWHADVAYWGSVGQDVNSHSVGISLEGNGCEGPFDPRQYNTLRVLLCRLRSRFRIRGHDIVGLGEVAEPPGRHVAPGRHFDWDTLHGYDATFLSRHVVKEWLLRGDVDPTDDPNGCLAQWGYGVGHYGTHLAARLELMADRYLTSDVEQTDIELRRCVRILDLWRARMPAGVGAPRVG